VLSGVFAVAGVEEQPFFGGNGVAVTNGLPAIINDNGSATVGDMRSFAVTDIQRLAEAAKRMSVTLVLFPETAGPIISSGATRANVIELAICAMRDGLFTFIDWSVSRDDVRQVTRAEAEATIYPAAA
jgi:hypothetical protein